MGLFITVLEKKIQTDSRVKNEPQVFINQIKGEVVNVPDMPDNACVQTFGNYSAIYWSERSEDGAMAQLLILHHGRGGIEINTKVRFDSLIQTIVFSKTKPNLMWCIEIPDPQARFCQ